MPVYRAGKRKRAPVHPGQIARSTLTDLRMSGRDAAARMFVSHGALQKVLEGGTLTPDMAVRFGKFFGNGAEIWLALQQDYDLWRARQTLAETVRKIKTLKAP